MDSRPKDQDENFKKDKNEGELNFKTETKPDSSNEDTCSVLILQESFPTENNFGRQSSGAKNLEMNDSSFHSAIISDQVSFSSYEMEDEGEEERMERRKIELENKTNCNEHEPNMALYLQGNSSINDLKEMISAFNQDKVSEDNHRGEVANGLTANSCMGDKRTSSVHDNERHNIVPQDQSGILFEEDQKPNLSEIQINVHFAEDGDDSVIGDRKSTTELEKILIQEEQRRSSPSLEEGEKIDLEDLTSDKVTESDVRALSHNKLVELLMQAVEKLKSYKMKGTKRKRAHSKKDQKAANTTEKPSPITDRKTRSSSRQDKSRVSYVMDEDDEEEFAEASSNVKVGKPQDVEAPTKTEMKKRNQRTVSKPQVTQPIALQPRVTLQRLPTALTTKASVQTKTTTKPTSKAAATSKAQTVKSKSTSKTISPVKGPQSIKASRSVPNRPDTLSGHLKGTLDRLSRDVGSSGRSSLEHTWVKVLQNLRSKLSHHRAAGGVMAKKTSGVPSGGPGKFPCQKCGKVLKTKESYLQHVKGLHSDRQYQCKQCQASFNFYHSFKLHMQKHNNERPHKCTMCEHTYQTADHLKVHIDAVHAKSGKVCHICGKTFLYHSSLKLHLQSHNSSLPYPCKQCDKAFPTEDTHRIHMREHRAERNFTCEICGKQFKFMHSKKAHVLTHSSERPVFICDICGRPFNAKRTLEEHMNIHTRATPYSCKICNKSFRYRSSLYHHKAEHREPETFLCNICGKSFRKKNLCTQHIKRHGESQDIPCTMCGGMFKDKQSLQKHISSIHLPTRLYRCTLCQKTGTRMDNMKTHLKSHHDAGIELDPALHIVKETHAVDSDLDVKAARPRLRKPKKMKAHTGQPVLPKQLNHQPEKPGQLPPQPAKPTHAPVQPANQSQLALLTEEMQESKASTVLPPAPASLIDPTSHQPHHYPAPPPIQEHPMAYQQAYNSMVFAGSPIAHSTHQDRATSSGNSLIYPPPRAHDHMAIDKSMLGYPPSELEHNASAYSLQMNPSVLYFKQF